MNASRRLYFAGPIVLLVMGLAASRVATGRSQPTGEQSPADATRRIVSAAATLLASLDDASRAKVRFPFSGPQRTRWSNFPSGIFQRQGLRLGDLTPNQRAAVMRLLQAALSGPGYQKVVNIMEGDDALRRPTAAMAPAAAGAAVRHPAVSRRVSRVQPRELPVQVAEVQAAESFSAGTSTISPFSAHRRRPRRGCSNSGGTISRST